MVHITSEQNKEISFQQQHEPVLASRSSPVNLEPSPAESWDFKCAMAKANRNPKPKKKTSKQHDLKSVLAQLARGDVHEVHPCAVGLVDAGVRPEQQRRHERAHERDPLGGVVHAGPGPYTFRTCGPVHRSCARRPVSAANRAAPPIAASTSRHCAVVLLSIHTGDSGAANAPASCGASPSAGSRAASRAAAPLAQYTLPCC
jgi:hypothetical protein